MTAPTPPAPAPEQAGNPPVAPEPKPAEAKPEIDWKAEARKHEQRAKENAQKAKDYDAFVESQKSEAQKLADRAAHAEKERDEARLEAIRLEVAQAKGLTPGQTKRLVGASRDELEADADQLVADLKQSVRPSGSVDQGQRGGAPKSTPQQDFVDFIARHTNRTG